MTDIGHFVARSPITVRTPMEPKGKAFLWGSGAAQKVAILDPAELLRKLAL